MYRVHEALIRERQRASGANLLGVAMRHATTRNHDWPGIRRQLRSNGSNRRD